MVLGILFWGSTNLPGRRLALTMLFSPMVLTPAATGTFFRLIYEPTFGIMNYLTTLIFGLKLIFSVINSGPCRPYFSSTSGCGPPL